MMFTKSGIPSPKFLQAAFMSVSLAISALPIVATTPVLARGTCKVSSAPEFPKIEITNLITATEQFQSSSQIKYTCSDLAGVGLIFCHFIATKDGVEGVQDEYYLVPSSSKKRLRFYIMAENANGGEYGIIPNEKSTISGKQISYFAESGRGDKFANWLTSKDATKLTVHLSYSNQDLAGDGIYGSTAKLITRYYISENDGNINCEHPPANPTGTFTTYLSISAKVEPTCRLEDESKTLDFGEVSAVAALTQNLRPKTNIGVRCTYETPYSLTLDNGRNYDESLKLRRMISSNGKNFIPYQLYDGMISGSSSPWTKVSGKGAAINTFNSHPIEGKLMATSAPQVGNYSDTVVITLNF